jgi:hypothetical protein
MILWQILLGIGIIYIIIKSIEDLKQHEEIIEYNMMQIGKKQKRPRWEPFSEMETEEDTAFAMPIDMLEEEN